MNAKLEEVQGEKQMLRSELLSEQAEHQRIQYEFGLLQSKFKQSQKESRMLQNYPMEKQALPQNSPRTMHGGVDESKEQLHQNVWEDQELCAKQKFLLGRSKKTIESIKTELSRLNAKRDYSTV